MKKYIRNCESCNKELVYSSNSSWNLAKRKNAKCRSCSTKLYAKRKSDCSFLKENSLEFFYWLGFIVADGHISNCRLKISLAKKDENHLNILANKLKTKIKHYTSNGHEQCAISVMDKTIICNLVDKYSIKSNKTEYPCNISQIKGDKLIAFKIGFIDGDGNIKNEWRRKDFSIRVKCHKNWLNNLKYMFPNENCYINNQGYSCITISNSVTCKELKKFSLDNKLPTLKRKWSIIDMNYVSKQELSKKRIVIVKEMLNKGISRKDIMKKINISSSGLSLLISRNDL